MNQAILTHLNDTAAKAEKDAADAITARREAEAKEIRDREAATKIYWDILCDPSRTSEPDKRKFLDAQRVLGKSADDVREDVEIVISINTVDEAFTDMQAAEQRFIAVHDEWRAWTMGGGDSGRNKALAAVHAKTGSLEREKARLDAAHTRAAEEWGRRSGLQKQHPEIARRLKDRAG
jgi:hypothetical protein